MEEFVGRIKLIIKPLRSLLKTYYLIRIFYVALALVDAAGHGC